MKTKASHQNRFLRIITIPFRALGKARDFYVRGITNYADKVGYGGSVMGGMPAANCATSLPKSFSVNSSRSSHDDNDDLRELIRAASARSLAGKFDINNLILQEQMMLQQQRQQQQQQQQQTSKSAVGPKRMPPRSCSVGMGRIDEEKPYNSLGEEGTSISTSKKPQQMYPRSRTYAGNKRSVNAF